MNNMKTKLLLLSSVFAAASAVATMPAFTQTTNALGAAQPACCFEGAVCCVPKSNCCVSSAANEPVTVNLAAVSSCCETGSACCATAAPCCP